MILKIWIIWKIIGKLERLILFWLRIWIGVWCQSRGWSDPFKWQKKGLLIPVFGFLNIFIIHPIKVRIRRTRHKLVYFVNIITFQTGFFMLNSFEYFTFLVVFDFFNDDFIFYDFNAVFNLRVIAMVVDMVIINFYVDNCLIEPQLHISYKNFIEVVVFILILYCLFLLAFFHLLLDIINKLSASTL